MQPPPSLHTAPSTKPVEILIHNVSHRDLVLSVCRKAHSADRSGWRRARPAFSCFSPISKAICTSLASLGQLGTADVVECPLAGAADEDEDEKAEHEQEAEQQQQQRNRLTAAGLRLPGGGSSLHYAHGRQPSAHALRERDLLIQEPLPQPPPRHSADDDAPSSAASAAAAAATAGASQQPADDVFVEDPGQLLVRAVYFPLIAVLVPKWLEISYDKSCQQRIYLISGCSAPRNPEQEMSGAPPRCRCASVGGGGANG
jgi:hypothetical protein